MNCKLERFVRFLFPFTCANIELKGWNDARKTEHLMRKHAPEAMHRRIEMERADKPSKEI
jgi:hypothetical protein